MTRTRRACVEDAAAIDELSRGLGYPALPGDELRRGLTALLASSSDRIWIIEDETVLLGWLHACRVCRLASSDFIEIAGLVVKPSARRQGIGRQLVQEARQWAGAEQVKLRVRCNSRREDSHHFYTALGFNEVKRQNVFELA